MLHYLWFGALLGVLALASRRFLGRAHPGVRYIVALTWLVALAATPVALVAWIRNAPIVELPSPDAGQHVARRTSPFRSLGNAAVNGWKEEEAPASPHSASPLVSDSEAATAATAGVDQSESWEWNRLVKLMPWIWLVGSPLMLAWTVVGLAGADRLRKHSWPVEDPRIDCLCNRLVHSMEITRRVSVRFCGRIAAPVLVGLVRPVILLPSGLLGSLGPDQVEMMLLHELAHVRRWDNLVNFFQRVVESLLFFHPMVWLVSRWVRQEREHCCDDHVLSRVHHRRRYAETLLTLARETIAATRSGKLLAGSTEVITSFAAHRDLRSRIQQILGSEDERMYVSRKLGVMVVIVLLMALIWAGSSVPSSGQAEPRERAGGAEETDRAEDSANWQSERKRSAARSVREELAELKELVRGTAASADVHKETLAALRREVETLRKELREAQQDRDRLLANVIELTDQLRQLTIQHKQRPDLPSRNNRSDIKSIPEFGVVVAVSEENQLVEISFGSDDGLAQGRRLDVARGLTYVGRIEVLKTQPDMSVCRILPEMRAARVEIGDRVLVNLKDPVVRHGRDADSTEFRKAKEASPEETRQGDPSGERPQGQKTAGQPVSGLVRWVNQRSRSVWVNLGRADRLKTGTVLVVYDDQDKEKPHSEPKAHITITQILEQHLAEARISEEDLSDLIMPGDRVYLSNSNQGREQRPESPPDKR
jgi:beta-lactamase regulating signal transducer with metallopeptidase domain